MKLVSFGRRWIQTCTQSLKKPQNCDFNNTLKSETQNVRRYWGASQESISIIIYLVTVQFDVPLVHSVWCFTSDQKSVIMNHQWFAAGSLFTWTTRYINDHDSVYVNASLTCQDWHVHQRQNWDDACVYLFVFVKKWSFCQRVRSPVKPSMCEIMCQHLGFFIMLVVYCKTKSGCHSRGWTEIWYLCTHSPVSLSHTNRGREKSQASSLHMHIFHHLAKTPANKPLFTDMKQHECFFQTSGTSFFIHQHRTTWILHWQKGTVPFFCFTEGLRKQSLSSSECKDAERHRDRRERSWNPFGNAKQFSKSGIKNSRAGQNICLLASVPVSKGCEHPPTDIEGLQYNSVLFLYIFYCGWWDAVQFHHLFRPLMDINVKWNACWEKSWYVNPDWWWSCPLCSTQPDSYWDGRDSRWNLWENEQPTPLVPFWLKPFCGWLHNSNTTWLQAH